MLGRTIIHINRGGGYIVRHGYLASGMGLYTSKRGRITSQNKAFNRGRVVYLVKDW